MTIVEGLRLSLAGSGYPQCVVTLPDGREWIGCLPQWLRTHTVADTDAAEYLCEKAMLRHAMFVEYGEPRPLVLCTVAEMWLVDGVLERRNAHKHEVQMYVAPLSTKRVMQLLREETVALPPYIQKAVLDSVERQCDKHDSWLEEILREARQLAAELILALRAMGISAGQPAKEGSDDDHGDVVLG